MSFSMHWQQKQTQMDGSMDKANDNGRGTRTRQQKAGCRGNNRCKLGCILAKTVV